MSKSGYCLKVYSRKFLEEARHFMTYDGTCKYELYAFAYLDIDSEIEFDNPVISKVLGTDSKSELQIKLIVYGLELKKKKFVIHNSSFGRYADIGVEEISDEC